MSETDKIIRMSEKAIERSRGRVRAIGSKSKALRYQHFAKKVGRILIALGSLVVAAVLFATFVQPLGIMGLLSLLLLMAAAAFIFGKYPAFPEPRRADLQRTDLKQLAGRTEIWLEAQRPALPPPARQLLDNIGVQLDLLAPQLQMLEANSPAASHIRKLVGDDLPELVSGYQRIPAGLRKEAHAGRTPDDTLVGGLQMLEREIGDAARNLAAGEMDKLATRERYLQLKYQGIDAEDS